MAGKERKPIFLVENFYSITQFPSRNLSVSSVYDEGYEGFRATNGRRIRTDMWKAAEGSSWIATSLSSSRTANMLAIDRGHNVGGQTVEIHTSLDGESWTLYDSVTIPGSESNLGTQLIHGARSPEGAFVYRFSPTSSQHWRVWFPNAAEIVGIWLGRAWEPEYHLDSPYDDHSYDPHFDVLQASTGWEAATQAATIRSGTLAIRLSSFSEWDKEDGPQRLFHQHYKRRRPCWMILDQSQAENAFLAVLPNGGRVAWPFRQGNWTYRSADIDFIEHEPAPPVFLETSPVAASPTNGEENGDDNGEENGDGEPASEPDEPTTEDFANEPDDPLVADVVMDAAFTDDWEDSPGHYYGPPWAFVSDNHIAHHSVVSDASAPASGDYIRFRHYAGNSPGTAPYHLRVPPGEPELERYYVANTIRLADYHGDGMWESHATATKLGFHGVGTDPSQGGGEIYTRIGGSGDHDNRLISSGPLMITQQGTPNWHFNTGFQMQVGVWYLWEIQFVLNDIGSANGTLEWWVSEWDPNNQEWTPQKILDETGVTFRDADNPHGFFYIFRWNPTWGGTGGPDKERDDYIDISHIRVRGTEL